MKVIYITINCVVSWANIQNTTYQAIIDTFTHPYEQLKILLATFTEKFIMKQANLPGPLRIAVLPVSFTVTLKTYFPVLFADAKLKNVGLNTNIPPNSNCRLGCALNLNSGRAAGRKCTQFCCVVTNDHRVHTDCMLMLVHCMVLAPNVVPTTT